MKSLEELRKEIDEIDTQIIALYEQRMNVVKDVSLYKIANNMQVLDASREAKMLEKNLAKINNEELKKYYQPVLNGFLTASRSMQEDIISKTK